MSNYEIRNKSYISRVHESFARQQFMQTIGAKLKDVSPGSVEIHLPFNRSLTQQHGFFHGGLIGTIADNAGGYSAFTLMAVTDSVLTIEFKVNFMTPANGELLIARGRVLRPGRTITSCQSDVYIVRDGQEKLCATMLGTFMSVAGMADDATSN